MSAEVTQYGAPRGVLINSIGWCMFNEDGREVIHNDDGNATIILTEDELRRCGLAVDRVLNDLHRGHGS